MVRSTIQRHLSTWNPALADLLPIDFHPLFNPDASQAAPRMLHDLHLPTERRFDPLDKAAFLERDSQPR